MPKQSSDDPKTDKALVKKEDSGQVSTASLPAEVIQALDASTSSVDVNVLLVQLIKKEPSPAEFVAQSREMLDMVKELEEWRLSNFKQRADAVIDAKTRDPDEIDKRANNGVRRFLRRLIGILAVLSLLGAGVGVWQGAPALVTTMLMAVVALSTSFAGVLAMGESVTTEEVVRVMREVSRGMVKGRPAEEEREQRPSKASRRRR